MAPGVVEDELESDGAPGTSVNALHTEGPTSASKPWTPQSVLDTLPTLPETGSTSPLPFFHLLERLKTTKREGWRRFGIAHGESIGDHMYRMAVLTMLAPPALRSRLDVARCTQMALVHDMAECLVGDITPVDGVPKREKSRREAETMDYLCAALLGRVPGLAGREIRGVWQEYEDGITLEARFVHDVDKMELLLQMVEYERRLEGRVDLGEFGWVATRIELEEVKVWAAEVLREREEFWKGRGGKAEGSDELTDEQVEQQTQYYGKGEVNGKTEG